MLFTKGSRIGPYTVVDRIGSGGVAEVYRVKRDGAEFALKILLHKWLEDESSIIRFQREIGILLQLRHDHIIYLFDHAEYEGRPYLVMPLLHGGSLREKIKALPQGQFFSRDETIPILRPLVSALSYAHGRSVNHYDVKPENILFNDEGNLFLSDFGMALVEGDTQNTTTRAGTVEYMAPEQFVKPRSELNCLADIYALGVIAYELLAGKRPWEFTKNIDRTKIPEIHVIRPDLSINVQFVLAKALAIDPQSRYTSATDFLEDLEKALAEPGKLNTTVYQPAIFVSKVTGLRSEWPVLDADYELLGNPIDEGGMGKIHKVRQRVDGQVRVIKTLIRATDQHKALFRREVEIAQSLQHEHIVPVLRYGFFQGSLAFVMPYLGGDSLAGMIAHKNLESKMFSSAEIEAILCPILGALAYAHQQGVKHLDLKPKNILFDEQNKPYLIDFGIAADGNVTEVDFGMSVRLGTRVYMSPEQIFRADRSMIDHRSDIYSVGLILYELLTGKQYYHGTDEEIENQHRIEAIPDITKERPDVSPQLNKVLKKCLAKHPWHRYGSVAELLVELREATKPVQKPFTSASPRKVAAAAFLFIVILCLFVPLSAVLISKLLSPEPTTTITETPIADDNPGTPTISVTNEELAEFVSDTPTSTPSATQTNTPTSTFTRTPSPTATSSETPTPTPTQAHTSFWPTPSLESLSVCDPNIIDAEANFVGFQNIEIKFYWPHSIAEGYYLELRVGSYTDKGEDYTDFQSMGQISPANSDGAGHWTITLSTDKLTEEGYYYWQIAYMKSGSRYPTIISDSRCFRFRFTDSIQPNATSTPRKEDK